MATVADKKTNYINRTLAAVDNLLSTVSALEALTQEGQVQGWVATATGPAANPLVDADFAGDAGYLTAAQFGQIMATLQTLDNQLHANNGQIISALFMARK